MSDAPDTTETQGAPTPMSRGRRTVVWVLIVVATVIGIASVMTTWVQAWCDVALNGLALERHGEVSRRSITARRVGAAGVDLGVERPRGVGPRRRWS
jgi:hypothetical protein